jgi:nicotinamidase-related amidase
MSLGLILIDIQNDYFHDGRMELEGSDQAAANAGKLLEYFRTRQLLIFHNQHLAKQAGATFFLPNTAGAEIHQSVQPIGDEKIVQKHYPNSFRETGLLQQLQAANVQRLIVAGMMTHMCVDATVRAACDYGFDCLIASDACATRSLQLGARIVAAQDVHTAFLAALNGVYGKVLASNEIVNEIERMSTE